MFFSRGRGEDELVATLVECHDHVRELVELAIVLADRTDVPPAEIEAGCSAIGRYFTTVFPLHVKDEETSILPRLRGRSASLDSALVRMHERHEMHESMLVRFCELTEALRIQPHEPGMRRALASVARPLKVVLFDHLDAEERIVFPMIRHHLSPGDCRSVRREIGARRRSGITSLVAPPWRRAGSLK